LDYDGLNKKWESNELTSDWESKLGEFEDSNFVEKYSFADAIHRHKNPEEWRAYDSSRFGLNPGEVINILNSRDEGNYHPESGDNNGTGLIFVKDLSQSYFRDCLVEHFDILYQRGQLIWPQRNGTKQPTYP
jgi:hypothetical protein